VLTLSLWRLLHLGYPIESHEEIWHYIRAIAHQFEFKLVRAACYRRVMKNLKE